MSLWIGKSHRITSDLRTFLSHVITFTKRLRKQSDYPLAQPRVAKSSPQRWEVIPDELNQEQVHCLVAGGTEVQAVRQVRVPIRLRLHLRPKIQHRGAQLQA